MCFLSHPRRLALPLLLAPFSLAAQIPYSGGVYAQSFDSLAGPADNTTGLAWNQGLTLPGWYSSRSQYSHTDGTLGGGASAFTVTNVAANVGLLCFGAASSADRALGLRSTGTLAGHDPVLLGLALTNTGAGPLTRFTVGYTGEQWFQADTNNAHTLFLEYKLGAASLADASGWTELPAARFVSPRTGSSPAALDGNAAPHRAARSATVSGISWGPGQTLWLRFRDANESGNEHGLAVDDFSFESSVAPPTVVTGPWSGNVGPDSATICAALDRAGVVVRALASRSADLSSPVFSAPLATVADNGHALRLDLSGLSPDTDYYYALELDGVVVSDPDRRGRFRTFPAPGPASFRLGFGACGHWSLGNQFVYDALAAEDIRLFLDVGDLNYANTASTDPAAYRVNYRDALSIGRQGALLRRHASAYIWDDHDFSGDNSDRNSLGRLAHRRVYRELVPHYPLPDVPPAGTSHGAIYQAFTLGRVRFLLTDLRSERDSAGLADTAAKSMLGAAQKAWFKAQLLAARDAETPLIVWASSVPLVSEDAAGDDWGRYSTERSELLEFIRNQRVQNLVVLAGDMHGLAADDGRGTATYVSGVRIPVFHAAAFNRPGSVKGGPYSLGASPGDCRYGLLDVTDDGLAPVSVTYTGKIAASATQTSVWARLTHVAEPVRPLAPVGLSATANADGIALAWTDRSGVESGFRLERASSADGPWQSLALLPADATAFQDDTTAPGATRAYRLVALNQTVESAPTAPVTATALRPLPRWKLRHFGDTSTPDSDDRDGDGRPALLEYALGGDPVAPDLAPGHALGSASFDGRTHLTLSFTRYPERSDIRYLVQAGSDLAAWDEIARSENGAPVFGPGYVSGDGDGSAPRVVQVRDPVPLEAATPRRFLRIRAER